MSHRIFKKGQCYIVQLLSQRENDGLIVAVGSRYEDSQEDGHNDQHSYKYCSNDASYDQLQLRVLSLQHQCLWAGR